MADVLFAFFGDSERYGDLSIIGDRASLGSGKPEPKTANNHTGKEYETPDNARLRQVFTSPAFRSLWN